MLKSLWKFYEEKYKKLLIIPLVIICFFSIIIIHTKLTTGSYFLKDISLKGGTSITYYTNHPLKNINEWLENTWGKDTELVIISNPISGFKGYEFRVGKELNIEDVKTALKDLTGKEISVDEFSMGRQGANIGSNFFKEALIILLISFIMMGLVVLYNFKSIIPAVSITFSTIADIIVVIGMLDLLGKQLSVAGIGALLMLIGLSTDSDILLATNIIKKKNIKGLKKNFKTELTMNLAAMTTSFIMLTLSNIDIIKSIALILMIGSISDMLDTWILSAGLQRLYMEWREKR